MSVDQPLPSAYNDCGMGILKPRRDGESELELRMKGLGGKVLKLFHGIVSDCAEALSPSCTCLHPRSPSMSCDRLLWVNGEIWRRTLRFIMHGNLKVRGWEIWILCWERARASTSGVRASQANCSDAAELTGTAWSQSPGGKLGKIFIFVCSRRTLLVNQC